MERSGKPTIFVRPIAFWRLRVRTRPIRARCRVSPLYGKTSRNRSASRRSTSIHCALWQIVELNRCANTIAGLPSRHIKKTHPDVSHQPSQRTNRIGPALRFLMEPRATRVATDTGSTDATLPVQTDVPLGFRTPRDNRTSRHFVQMRSRGRLLPSTRCETLRADRP